MGAEPLLSDAVLPRADATLALRTLERQPNPLGRGVWVLDASEQNNLSRASRWRTAIPAPGLYETRVFGPFLVLRTREPVGTVDAYIRRRRGWCSPVVARHR